MQGAQWWLVCYDVRDPERLRRAAHHMEGYGERIQYSIFRCWMTRLEMERLRWELTDLLDPADAVMLIPLCGNCVAGIRGIHHEETPAGWPAAPPRHLIV